jgi:hypothetical protein
MRIMGTCSICNRVIEQGARRCQLHGGDQRGLTSAQRGYGHAHRMRRAALLPLAIGTSCPLCGQLMLAHQRLDLHHSVPLRLDPTSIADEIVHASCNRGGQPPRGGNRTWTKTAGP